MHIAVDILAALMIIAGTLSSILPFLPGLPVAWLGLFIYAWSNDFTNVNWGLLIIAILIGMTLVVNAVAPAMAAKKYRASREGVIGTLIGMLIGIAVLGPVGIIFGPIVGAFVGELISGLNEDDAIRAAVGAMGGMVISSLFRVAIGSGIFIYFVIKLI